MPIKYAAAVWEAKEERWISDDEIAEVPFTAFTSKKKAFHTAARLIVRRVKRLNPTSVPEGQAELFGVWRHHVIFTDSPFVLAQAEPMHREHAQVEQVFADLEDSALASRHTPWQGSVKHRAPTVRPNAKSATTIRRRFR